MSVTPAAWQASYSDARIGREALAMSIWSSPTPSQKRASPAPVPPPSTTGVGKSKFSPKASAAMVA